MDKKLHIILTGETCGNRSYVFAKAKIKAFFIIFSVFILVATFSGIFFPIHNIELRDRVAALENELSSTLAQNDKLQNRVAQLEHDVEEPLKNALTALNQRSKLIETILDTVGVEIKVEESSENSGGPYAELSDDSYDDLVYKVDQYLDTINPIPLGYPIQGGRITSKFGRRIDPFNKKPAMHYGIDIKNRLGTKVHATAEGKVVRQTYDSKYGRYVMIDHGNGFQSIYGHNKKALVKAGQRVKRGDAISLLGSTGRSTGPHVHYELHYKGKPIDPMKFMTVAKSISPEARSLLGLE